MNLLQNRLKNYGLGTFDVTEYKENTYSNVSLLKDH